jgi:hypothetical protein
MPRKVLPSSALAAFALFSPSNPGRVQDFAVVGRGRDAVVTRIELTGPFPLIRKKDDGTIYEVVDAKGRVYSVRSGLGRGEDRMTILASAWSQVSIPFADARQIEVRKSNALLIAAIIGGSVVALTFLPLIF